jgi:formate dehydrogenase maturation protein FdhE
MIVPPLATDTRWAARITRARSLAGARPEARAALAFYAEFAGLQQSLAHAHKTAAPALTEYLEWLQRNAPPPIAEASISIETLGLSWDALVEGYPASADDARAFVAEGLLQAFPSDPCPYCSAAPVVSVLRDAAHGSRRSKVCAVCLAESPAPRLGCLNCGEADVDKLPVFRTEATDPARIDACDSCHGYVKTIDFTRDALACLIADDLASVSLDLWAREQGYRRPRPNLLRL